MIPALWCRAAALTNRCSRNSLIRRLKNEADNGLRNTRGTIAMARTADQDSATSQFFINIADNAFLSIMASVISLAMRCLVKLRSKAWTSPDKISGADSQRWAVSKCSVQTYRYSFSAKVLP